MLTYRPFEGKTVFRVFWTITDCKWMFFFNDHLFFHVGQNFFTEGICFLHDVEILSRFRRYFAVTSMIFRILRHRVGGLWSKWRTWILFVFLFHRLRCAMLVDIYTTIAPLHMNPNKLIKHKFILFVLGKQHLNDFDLSVNLKLLDNWNLTFTLLAILSIEHLKCRSYRLLFIRS